MNLKREGLLEIMNVYFDGNYNRFAREINVNVSHLHKFIKTGVGGGKKVIGAIFLFCKKMNTDFERYVEK